MLHVISEECMSLFHTTDLYTKFSFFSYSLLSHSAVVARELGLPTIVGVSGGLMKRLKTGMRVHIDAGKVKLDKL